MKDNGFMWGAGGKLNNIDKMRDKYFSKLTTFCCQVCMIVCIGFDELK